MEFARTGKWKTGALAIGSSEACMLGGVAAWLRWKDRRKAQGKPTDKPNFVISSGFQVVWEKFAQLWQIEMRQVPLTLDKTTLDPEEALKMCDENTICIVPIQGVTWTGLNDDVEALDKALMPTTAKTGYDIPIHVDAATGGFILPFLNPDTKWDFRLKWVLSISTSGHKFGLVYPGLGWVSMERQEIPSGCHVVQCQLSGCEHHTGWFELQPPRRTDSGTVLPIYPSGIPRIQSHPIQFHGNHQVHPQRNSQDDSVRKLQRQCGEYLCSSGTCKPEYAKNAKWTLYDLQAKLQQSGWMVPAYTLPENIQNYVVMRVVVRQGFSRDMADMLLNDIKNAISEFEKLEYPTQTRIAQDKNITVKGTVFTHNAHSNAAKK